MAVLQPRSGILGRQRRSCARRVPRRKGPVKRATAVADAGPQERGGKVFQEKLALTPPETALAAIPGRAKNIAGALIVLLAGATGAAVGGALPQQYRGAGRAVAGGLAGAGGAYGALKGETRRKRVVAKRLWNSFAEEEMDPHTVTRDEVEQFEEQYGARGLAADYPRELAAIYDAYLTAMLPESTERIEGWEPAALRRFKEALALEDSDAASVHLEVGRRIFRRRMEEGDREGEVSARKEFQSLVYISTLVFGEAKSRFMLPWQRVFNMTDSHVAVAIREGATGLYRKELKNTLPYAVEEADESQLRQAKSFQESILLKDEHADEVYQEMARSKVERIIGAAAEEFRQKARTREVEGVKAKLDDAISYNRKLAHASMNQGMPPGVRPIRLPSGGVSGAREQDMKDLYRMYIAESVKDGFYDADTASAVDELKTLLSLVDEEAQQIARDVCGRVYRNIIRRSLADGRLENADSPAGYLESLCDNLEFPPEQAESINKELYLHRLQEAMQDSKLDEEEEQDLNQMRRLLCLSEDMAKQARKDVCGKVYRNAVEEALGAGVDGFSPKFKERVKNTQNDVKLDNDTALEILSEVAQRAFMSFIREARSKANKLENAKELRKMVFFNTDVVTPLVNDLDPKQSTASEIADIMKEAKEKADLEQAEEDQQAPSGEKEGATAEQSEASPSSEQSDEQSHKESQSDQQADEDKTEQQKEQERLQQQVLEQQQQKNWQSTVSLKDQLSDRDKKELYKNYLIFCMTGDQVDAPMGQVITVERDQAEFVRLQEVGDILGLESMEVMEVQRDLSEQAFRANAEQVLQDGNLTQERKEQLQQLQQQLQLPDESSQRIINEITNKRYASDLQRKSASGQLSVDDLLEMREQGVDVESVASHEQRMRVFRQAAENALSDGSGGFSLNRFVEELPNELSLNKNEATKAVEEAGSGRKRNMLVQAISSLRQKSNDGTIKALNNLASCQAASTSQSVQWGKQEELEDLFCFYVNSQGPDSENLPYLRDAFGLSQETEQALRDRVSRHGFALQGDDVPEDALY